MPSFLSICWFLLPSHHAQLCKYLPFESYINNKLDLYCIHYHVYPRKCFSLYTHWHIHAVEYIDFWIYITRHIYIYICTYMCLLIYHFGLNLNPIFTMRMRCPIHIYYPIKIFIKISSFFFLIAGNEADLIAPQIQWSFLLMQSSIT